MEALQHLVDDDPEPLVDRRLLRNAEDPCELVLERAGPVEVDVGRGQRQALAAAREEGLERGLVALGDQLAAPLCRALLVEEIRVEPGVAQCAALLGEIACLEEVVDRRQGVRYGLLGRSLDQPGQLDQLEEARDRSGDVDVGVEPRLAELAAGAPGLLQHLVLDHPVGRLEPLGRPEELLALLLLRGVEDRPRVLVERRRAGVPGLGRGGSGEDQLVPGAGHRHVEQPPRLVLVRWASATHPGGYDRSPRGGGARHGAGVQTHDVHA